MNNEFTKINNGKEVRYVLEDGGSTTTGAVATVEKPLGELQRRTDPPKPRNFVAKNAKMGGAGQHKDKKKAEKQGSVKHKKPFMESEANVSDRELDTIDPQDQGEEEGSFVKNQIHTMLRVLTHLEHAIGDEEDLPEWVQMKLSQAQQSVVGVMDYMISEKEREVERQTGGHSLMKEQGVAEGLNEFAPPERKDGQGDRFFFQEDFESDDGKYIIEIYAVADSNSYAVSFHRGDKQYVMYPIDGLDAGDLSEGADRYVQEIKQNAAHGSQNDFIGFSSMDLEDFIPPEQGVAEDPYFNMLERSVSQAQHNLMVGVANNPQFAQKVKVKQRVGQEFAQADQGHDISALPIRVPKKK